MWRHPDTFDVIVIGGGHAGYEAAHAAAKMGSKTLLLSLSLDTIGKMSCNPAIGGTAKGHIVREIDALGGIMGRVADETAIQYRMLNRSKGPAVWSPRCQSDRTAYQTRIKEVLENTSNLFLMQGTIQSLLIEKGTVIGVSTQEGIDYHGHAVILCAGTFMRGLLHIGEKNHSGGRAGDKPSTGLPKQLDTLGFKMGRLKTGTPPRIHGRSIDFTQCEEQPGESDVRFSHDPIQSTLPQTSCFITYTSPETKRIVQKSIERSPTFSGKILSVGPRYCPSIEDKVHRFADKERHQIFLEPEGHQTHEYYVNGISTSFPMDVQLPLLRSIPGLEKAEVMRVGYAIEYDYLTSGQLTPTLESKQISGLYFAGQVNGTTGYEEAAGQGLIAGINAAAKIQNKPPLILRRDQAYIGVMIDELNTKELTEPYRMFTSRAEHRLLLRQDNADLRLRTIGHTYGLISDEQFARLQKKKEAILKGTQALNPQQLKEIRRPESTYQTLIDTYQLEDFGPEANYQIEIDAKYSGYISRQMRDAKKLEGLEAKRIPSEFDFSQIIGLRNEAQEKLIKHHPHNLGQASRISGVSPADLQILMVALKDQ